MFALHHQKLCTKGDSQLIKTWGHRRIAGQNLHTNRHLKRITKCWCQRFVHIGDQRHCRAARPIGCADQRLRQGFRIVVRFHKRARPAFYIQNQTTQTSGQLFRQDRRGDQINAFNRRGHITDCIKSAVGRCDLPCSTDNRTAHLAGQQAQSLL